MNDNEKIPHDNVSDGILQTSVWILLVVAIMAALTYLTAILSTEAKASELMMCNGRMMWGDGTGECPRVTRRRAEPQPEYRVRERQPQRLVVTEPTLKTINEHLEPKTVYVNTKDLTLYYMVANDLAIVYPIAVGREGVEMPFGAQTVSRVADWPSWRPTPGMLKKDPKLEPYYPGGPRNPLGRAAIYLGDTLYRIHGTNAPWTIGTRASSGCIRMYNSHVEHLISYVDVGTKVIVR